MFAKKNRKIPNYSQYHWNYKTYYVLYTFQLVRLIIYKVPFQFLSLFIKEMSHVNTFKREKANTVPGAAEHLGADGEALALQTEPPQYFKHRRAA